MKTTVLVLSLALLSSACGSGYPTMTEPTCEQDMATGNYGLRCDGEIAFARGYRWSLWCTDGSAVTATLEDDGASSRFDCEGECQELSPFCEPDTAPCPEGMTPLCVFPANFCDLNPEASPCI